MARQREVVNMGNDEDIVYVEHHLQARYVRLYVGRGTIMPDGAFVETPEQNYENVVIQDAAYDLLMSATDTKPADVFRKDDLWQFVDIGRQKAEAERELIAQRTADQAAQPAKGKPVV